MTWTCKAKYNFPKLTLNKQEIFALLTLIKNLLLKH